MIPTYVGAARSRIMNVEVRLFATLRRHLPPGGGRTAVRLDLAAGASVADALAHLGIPDGSPLIILLDGRYEADPRRALHDGCVLSVFPPIAGG